MSTSYALQLLRGFGTSSKENPSNRKSERDRDVSALGRWLRDLRPGGRSEPPPPPPLQRHHPAYHSEGRGPRRRRHQNHQVQPTSPSETPSRDHRRHSFNENPRQRCYSNGGSGEVTGATVGLRARHVSLLHTMMSARSTPNLQPGPGTVSPPPAPPVRDASSMSSRCANTGPGHEKFPSWPVPAAADTPPALRAPPTGGSTRSKSWTDHTEYPKEQPLTYTRPYMKRQHHSAAHNKQLKTVMERCEKLGPEVFDSRRYEHRHNHVVLPFVDREGKALGDMDYAVPSPPERDAPALTQADLEAYLHHKQPSYAHSEGYHSYVSSASDSTTPFLDRLRRDSEAKSVTLAGGRDSVVTTSSGSASSSETLKWHGSLSDVSTHSHSPARHQLIAHSARVQTPQRHHSESVLYMDPAQQQQHQRKLFPVTTYTVQPHHQHHTPNSAQPPSVADRVNELERQHQHHNHTAQRYTYLDPDKKHRVSDPTLKAIQKKALLSFYERHHSSWRSEPQLAVPQAPQPPPRGPGPHQPPSRRASCASDYAGSLRRGPVIVGPAISVDDWVPERPPKNPALRSAYSPPPPSPPPTPDLEAYNSDEPLPPPPPASDLAWQPLPPPVARPWHRQSFMHSKPLPPPPLSHTEPPPLHPRTTRINQSMRARIPYAASSRKSPPEHRERERERERDRHNSNNMSASKASYLAARREREVGLCGGDPGSYKRTMSPDTRDMCVTTRLQPIQPQPLVRRASLAETKPPPLPDVLPHSPPRLSTPPASPQPSPKSSPPPLSPPLSPQPQVIEALQLIQRTEVTLRVNTSTSDAGCQTEEDKTEDVVRSSPTHTTPLPTRRKLQEEIECERLQQDLADHLDTSDRLKCILVPGPEHRKPTDYVSGLFKVEVTSRSRATPSGNTPPASPPPEPPSPLSSSSAYFTTSEPRAKFLTSISRCELGVGVGVTTRDTGELSRKKEELVSRLARKLEVLRGEARAVAEERRVNDELGAAVARRVAQAARPHEAAKFRLHVDEVGQITALLLGLSGRLARAENALMSLEEASLPTASSTERKSLEDKRDKLAAQLAEAKQLKESIDRRSTHVSNMLVQYLGADEYADYDHFINMKAKLIMDARDIGDKIKLGEEQLQALKDTLQDV